MYYACLLNYLFMMMICHDVAWVDEVCAVYTEYVFCVPQLELLPVLVLEFEPHMALHMVPDKFR